MYKHIVFYFLLSNSLIFSAYLRDVPQKIKQPDGSVVECFSSGDEFYNWVHDENGYTIVRSQVDGYCYYANEDLTPSIYRVGDVNPELVGIRKWIKLPKTDYLAIRDEYIENDIKRTPTVGTVNNLNVFIRFADESEFGGTFTYYDTPFNLEQGPSMRHYFQEVSYNMLDAPTTHFPLPDGENVISYQDEYPRSYYEPYNAQTNPDGYTGDRTFREHTLLRKAIEFIEDEVPLDLNIDGDNDGRVDNVTFLVYGSPGAWADLLWPHRWSLYSQYVTIHGKQVWDYNFNMETGGYFTVGTLAHEFNHSLSAPDLYHYNETGAPVACGGWDVMDASGSMPGYMGAFMKAKYGGWIQDTNNDGQRNHYDIPLLDSPGIYELNPLHDSTNYAYRLKSPYTDNQYFIVEYRYKQGLYETTTPGNDNGLLVYRINTCCSGNAQGPPDEVYIYRPNGDADTNGNLGQAIFSEDVGRTKINDQTNPSAFLYLGNLGNGDYCDDSDGCNGGLYITDIGSPGETITFKYLNVFLNAELNDLSNDSDGDGILNPGENATLNFTIENTSIDGFAYALTANLEPNEYFEILSDEVFIDELPAGQESPRFSFDIKVDDDAPIGTYKMGMNISATVYQDGFGEFDYDDIVEYDFNISIDQKGFPFETADQVFCAPAVVDLDQDGNNEIIFGDNSGMFYFLNDDMTIYNSYNIGDEIWGAPAIDDLDGDGDLEVAITSKNGFFYIFNHLGNLIFGQDFEAYLMGAPAVGTYTNSETKAIYVPTFESDGKIYQIRWSELDGDYLIDYSTIGKKIQKGVALHDLNGDGLDEIVFGTDDNTLEVLSYSGNLGDVYDLGGKVRSAPVIIEFNNNEFLIAAGSKDDNLYAFNPILGTEQFIYETGGDVESPSVFEHSQYGTVIVFGSADGNLYMIDTNGGDIPGWPKDLGAPAKGSPAISDINGDGLADIFIGQSEGRFFGFDENGNILNNFPMIIEFPFTASPTIVDIDLDGDLEVLVGGSVGLYGYDIKNENGNNSDYWSMYRGNLSRKGFFQSENYLGLISDQMPESFNISSVYPNPFNPKVNIEVDIASNEIFNLSIYNLQGALVQELYNGTKAVGRHLYSWDASMYSSGIYFVRLRTFNSYKSNKLMLVK
tara:strand:- start:11014 stop:14415 length:3402 start_codon:yes stop_codon:yes gene_type:complete